MKKQLVIGSVFFVIGLTLVLAMRPFIVTGQEGKGKKKSKNEKVEAPNGEPKEPVCVCPMNEWAHYGTYCSYYANYCGVGYGNFDAEHGLPPWLCPFNGDCNDTGGKCFPIGSRKSSKSQSVFGNYAVKADKETPIKIGVELKTAKDADTTLMTAIEAVKGGPEVTVLRRTTVGFGASGRKARIYQVLVVPSSYPAQVFCVGREIQPNQPTTCDAEEKVTAVDPVVDVVSRPTKMLDLTFGDLKYRIFGRGD